MGCSSSRDMSPEEATLYNGEVTLLYSSHHIKDVAKSHASSSADGKITSEEWKNISKSLNLAIAQDNPREEIVGFYESFQKKGNFNPKSLIVLAALLTKGSGSEKAEAIFKAFNSLESIKKEDLAKIIDMIFDIALDKLPALVLKDDRNNVTKEQLDDFLLRGKMGRKTSEKEIIDGVSAGQDPVQLCQFTAWFNKSENSGWLISTDLRKKLRANGKSEFNAMKKKAKEEEEQSKPVEHETHPKVSEENGNPKEHESQKKPEHHEAHVEHVEPEAHEAHEDHEVHEGSKPKGKKHREPAVVEE